MTDLVITSFNGQELLKKQLPVVLKFSPNIHKIIVVDDASTDGTVEFLKSKYPKIECIPNPKNLGFTKSTNIGVSHSKADFVVLLNNDVYPQKHYLDSALKLFKTPDIFAVTFNEIHSSWPDVTWQGKISFTEGQDKSTARWSAWASGGSSIVRRSIWERLGGFNPIYSPGYWEDIDLGWRAWKMGYKIVWDPRSTVEHIHESTFGKLNPNFVSMLKQRNELLFNWQNISEPKLVLSHIKYLTTYSLTHPGFFKVILAALGKLPETQPLTHPITSDSSILKQINLPYHE